MQIVLAAYVLILTHTKLGLADTLRYSNSAQDADRPSQKAVGEGIILIDGVERPLAATNNFQMVLLGI